MVIVLLWGALAADRINYEGLSFAWALPLSETAPPAAPVRPIAEFEPSSHVIIRYPLGIPTSLVAQLSNTAQVICLVASNSQMNSATSSFNSANVNMANVSFMIAPTDSYWTRDYSPWFIYDGNGEYGVVDFNYNRPRPNDNQIPQRFAQQYNIPYYAMNISQTGGNYMTDGINTAAQSHIAYTENNNNQTNVNNKMRDYLGITSYHVVQDPNNTYIDHIDCWGKFLAPDKIIIRSVPTSHPRYNALEATANYFASQICAWGYPYKVYRVYTPNDQPYSNSLILNKKVFVPQMNSTHDAAALQSYRDAMPGYEVIGVYGASSTPWESTDALHCRTHEVPDAGMLHIAHYPYHGTQVLSRNIGIEADITAHSGATLLADSLYVRYRVNSGDWQFAGLINTGSIHYESNLGAFSAGDTLRYYIHAADSSGRSADHPIFASLEPHVFVIEGDATPPQLAHTPLDSIGSESVNFILWAEDDSGIAQASLSYQVDDGEIITVEMADAGGGLYLYLFEPDFQAGDLVFNYRFSATDINGNRAYLPAENQWYSLPIEPVSVADIHSPTPQSKINIYPNPFSKGERIHIAYEVPKADKLKLEVYNLRGQMVYSHEGWGAAKDELNWKAVDKYGKRLGSGVYFLRLEVGKESFKRKLIITH